MQTSKFRIDQRWSAICIHCVYVWGFGGRVCSSSSEQLVRVEAELKEKNAKIAEITQEMNNMRAGLAKAESMSASGTAASDEVRVSLYVILQSNFLSVCLCVCVCW